MLGNAQRHAHYVNFLERIGADEVMIHVARDADERHGIHKGVGNTGDQVRCPRTGGGNADAEASGRPRVPVRGKRRPLLRRRTYVPDLSPVAVERVVKRNDRSARITEHRAGTGQDQFSYDILSAIHTLRSLSARRRIFHL